MRLPEALEVLRRDPEMAARRAHGAQLALLNPRLDSCGGDLEYLGDLSGGQVVRPFFLQVLFPREVVIFSLVRWLR